MKEEKQTVINEEKEITFNYATKEVKSIVEQIYKQQITVGEFLQNIILKEREEKGQTKIVRDYMEAQRDFVWEKWRTSNLFLSLLLKVPIGLIEIYRSDERNQFRKTADGQQRLTSLYLGINNHIKFDFSKSMYPVFKIQGIKYKSSDFQDKTFSELPEIFQDIILGYDLQILTYNNCTDEQAELIYVMKNGGLKSLKAVELRKAAMGINTRRFIAEVLKSNWVLHTLTEKTAKGNTGKEIISQVITLLHSGRAEELSKENIDKVIYSFRNDGVPENLRQDMTTICNYLNVVSATWITNKKKTDEQSTKKKPANYSTYRFTQFNKTNIVMLMVAADKAIKNNVNLESFAEWSLKFFKEPSEDYNNGLVSKVNELQMVDMRMLAIDEEIKKLEKDEVKEEEILDVQGEQQIMQEELSQETEGIDTDNDWTDQDDENVASFLDDRLNDEEQNQTAV